MIYSLLSTFILFISIFLQCAEDIIAHITPEGPFVRHISDREVIAIYDPKDLSGRAVLDGPTDLQFNPDPNKSHELWISAQGSKGVLKITYPGRAHAHYEGLLDPLRDHFMAGISGIAFGPKSASEIPVTNQKYIPLYEGAYNFATSQDSDGGRQENLFMGPVLWNVATFIHSSKKSQNSWGARGSHIDMLHESPYSLGITHYKGPTFGDPKANFSDNTFIVVDGFSKSLTLYDFVRDHGPGHYDHSDGIVRRFLKGEILAHSTGKTSASGAALSVATGIVYDAKNNLIYVSDAGNGRVLSVNLQDAVLSDEFAPGYAGNGSAFPTEPQNPSSYRMCDNVSFSILASSEIKGFEALVRPSGIAIRDSEIAIADYETGTIYIAAIKTSYISDVIETGYQNSIMGLEIGPDGALYVAAYKESEILRYEGIWPKKDVS